MPDAVVVGGGLAGCATAYYLARDGVQVELLEQGELNALASGANSGSLHVQIPAEPFRVFGEDWARRFAASLPLFTQSLTLWRAASAELDIDLGVQLRGGLMVAATDAEMRLLERKTAIERASGVDVAVIGRDELRRLAPYLAPHLVGAAFCPDEGKANPLLAAPAFAAAAARHGARIRRQVTVTGLRRSGTGYVLATTAGDVHAARVVNAAGAGARQLAGWLGVDFPMRAEPIQVSVTEPVEPLIPHLVYAAGEKLTLKQTANGSLLIGGGWPARLDAAGRPVTDPDSLGANLRVALGVLPQLGGVQVLRTWAALVNGTDSWRPMIGELPGNPGCWLCYVPWVGFTGGPAAARIVASLLQGKQPPFEIDVEAVASLSA